MGSASAALASGWLRGYSADAFEVEGWARGEQSAVPETPLAGSGRRVSTPGPGDTAEREHRHIVMAAARQIYQYLSGHRPDGAVNEPALVKELALA